MGIFKSLFGGKAKSEKTVQPSAKVEPAAKSVKKAPVVKPETLKETALWAKELSKLKAFPGLVTGTKEGGKEIHFLHPATGEKTAPPLVFPAEIQAYAVAPRKGLAATAEKDSRSIRIWDYQNGAEKGLLDRPEMVTALAWDEAQELLVVGHKDTRIAVIKVPSGEEIRSLAIPPETMGKVFEKPLESVSEVALSPDGMILAGIMGEGVLATWDLRENGNKVSLHLVPPNRFFGFRFSPDGRYLAAAAGSYKLAISFSVGQNASVSLSETKGMLWLLDLQAGRSHSVSDTSFVMEDVFWTADGKEILALAAVPPIMEGLSKQLHVYSTDAVVAGGQSPARKYMLGRGPLGGAAAHVAEDRAFYIVLGDKHLHTFSLPPSV